MKNYKIYQAKTILNTHKHVDGGWFWSKYSAYPYVGCQWGCVYCYWRDEKYSPYKPGRDPETLEYADPFSECIKVKENAPELFRKSLQNKPKEIIYLDNYQPVDRKYHLNREMLQVCLDLGFPVFINEKSPLVLNDIDILKQIDEKSYLNVGFSIITTKDDKTRQFFENKAPKVADRLKAMAQLAENNILTGAIFMPILPFIYDSDENIEAVIKDTKEAGGQYILDGGLTLWRYCGDYFYKQLQKYDKNLVIKYKALYGNAKQFADYSAEIHGKVLKYCQKYGLKNYIERPVSFYPKELQINKKIAERFYLEAKELMVSGKSGYREFAIRKAAWVIDDLDKGLDEIYKEKGIVGLKQIDGIGDKLACRIVCLIGRRGAGEGVV